MNNAMRSLGLFQLLLFAPLQIVLFGCAAAVDEPVPSEAASTSASEFLERATAANETAALGTNAANCAATPISTAEQLEREELTSILETSNLALDASGSLGSTCTAACACCKRGNRFCCSHCRFCSGPIGVVRGTLAP